MAREILGEYGPESSQPQKPRATDGGRQHPKEIPYSPPVGPKGINDLKSPGLHGENHGNFPGQGRH